MIENPVDYIDPFIEAGADILVAGSAIFNDRGSIEKNVGDLTAELS